MKTEDYWLKKQLEREEKYNRLADEELRRKIKKYYEKALREIEKEIAAVYGRFAVDNKLSNEAARKLLTSDEFRVWRMTLREYVKAAETDSAILRELNILAAKSKLSRLETLYARTLMEVAELSKDLEGEMNLFLSKAYLESRYQNLYDYHKTTGLLTPPAAVDNSQVEKVLKAAWSGENYSSRIRKNGKKLAILFVFRYFCAHFVIFIDISVIF